MLVIFFKFFHRVNCCCLNNFIYVSGFLKIFNFIHKPIIDWYWILNCRKLVMRNVKCGRGLQKSIFLNPDPARTWNTSFMPARPSPYLKIKILCRPGPARTWKYETRPNPDPPENFKICFFIYLFSHLFGLI